MYLLSVNICIALQKRVVSLRPVTVSAQQALAVRMTEKEEEQV
jgi:hypothetical protein